MSRLGAPATAEEVRDLMLDRIYAPVGTPAMAQIERDLTPIIAELATLGPGNDQHPAVRQLFNWLVDPQHTVEEFNHVIGPLAMHVNDIMEEQFNRYMYSNSMLSTNLGKIAAEALAVRCPVLEGSWEQAAWFVSYLNKPYNYGVASKYFSAWIIQVIGDPDLCPSSYLRINLMNLLLMMVELNDENRTQALQSVISACSTYSLDYHIGGYGNGFFNTNLIRITTILSMFEFDENLADRLNNDIKSRRSIMIHDVAYNHSLNPSRYTEPKEVHALSALLKTTTAVIQLEYKCFHEGDFDLKQFLVVRDLSYTLKALFNSCNVSVQMPQLIEITTSCIMDFVELVLLVNIVATDTVLEMREMKKKLCRQSLSNTNKMLENLIDVHNDNLPNSPMVKEMIWTYYSRRLKNLRENMHEYNCEDFPMICDLLQCSI